jgi:hypothetical protein
MPWNASSETERPPEVEAYFDHRHLLEPNIIKVRLDGIGLDEQRVSPAMGSAPFQTTTG